MSGFTLGQPYGHGRTFQHTIIPGTAGANAAPSAGANYTYVVSPWDAMRLVFCRFSLTTSAVAGNRYVTIEYPGPTGGAVVADGAAVLVGPSTTAQRFIGALGRSPAEWNTGTDVFFPLSGIWLEAGRTLTITVANIDTADQLSSIRLTFDTLQVPADGSEIPHAITELRRATAYADELAHALE